MPRNTLAKHYEQLTQRERLQLMLAAQAREDETEIEQLLESCPRKHYRAIDAAFDDAHQAIVAMNTGVAAELNALLAEYGAIHKIFNLTPPLLHLAAIEADGAIASKAYAPTDPASERDGFAVSTGSADEECDTEAGPDLDDISKAILPRTNLIADSLRGSLSSEVVAKIRGIMTAYDRVCRQILGMSSEDVLTAFDATLSGLIAALPDDIDPNAEVAERTESALIKIWSEMAAA